MDYPQRWLENADTPLTVYVPSPRAEADGVVRGIKRGSGIVGRPIPGEPGRVEICFEGNLYDIESMRPFSERVRQASGRLITKYPTVARAWVEIEQLVPIGTYVPRTHDLQFTNLELLATWLDEAVDPLAAETTHESGRLR